MSWLLLLVVAGGAIFFLLRAREQSRKRFEEVLRREAEAQARSQGQAPGSTDKRKV